MKTLKNDRPVGYFTELPKNTQDLVRELIIEVAKDRNGPDCWKTDDEAVESIECTSRSGFIPFDYNRGGLVYQNYTDLMGYFGGGYVPTHDGANKEIARQIEVGLQNAREETYTEFKTTFEALHIEQKDVNYGNIQGLSETHPQLEKIVEYISDRELEQLGTSESSIMHELRFMYHGKQDGEHTASVSAALNTEGPYHRSSIAWAPKVFCEGSKEVEITWKTQAELKKKLKVALNKVSKAIF